MSADPKKVVEEFLDKQGFPFEMKVAGNFQKRDFGIQQSLYYVDLTTGTPREIDVIAIWVQKIREYIFNVVFVVECKYAKTPWILFSSITKGYPICYVHNERAARWMIHLAKQEYWEHFFEIDRNIGYGLTTTNPKDNAHEAIQKLLGFLKSERKFHRFAHANDYTIYVPIIAIRGKLFGAKLNDTGDIETREINEAQVFYKEDLYGVIPKIHVVTESNLDYYISRLVDDCKRLFIDPYMSNEITNPPFKPTMSVHPSQPPFTL